MNSTKENLLLGIMPVIHDSMHYQIDIGQEFTIQGIPIALTIRRYPRDTVRNIVPNVKDTPKVQDQDVWQRPRHLGKTKTSNKSQTNSKTKLACKTKLSDKTKITWWNIICSSLGGGSWWHLPVIHCSKY